MFSEPLRQASGALQHSLSDPPAIGLKGRAVPQGHERESHGSIGREYRGRHAADPRNETLGVRNSMAANRSQLGFEVGQACGPIAVSRIVG
jgi:hypothetical protein